MQAANRGTAFPMDEATIQEALSEEWFGPAFIDPWVLPAGAYKRGGPT